MSDPCGARWWTARWFSGLSSVVAEGGNAHVGICPLPLFVELPIDLRQEVLVEQPIDEGGVEVLLQLPHDLVGQLVGLPVSTSPVATRAVTTDDDLAHLCLPSAAVAFRLMTGGVEVELDDAAIVPAEETGPATAPATPNELLGGESTQMIFHYILQDGEEI
jgi:hypothetical protein